MGFHFLNPIFWWGALAAAVPIIVHLIHRRRTKTVQFAMLDFILQSQKRKTRKFRLKEWLLLAVRTAMVLALVGLGAHPVVIQAAETLGRAYPSHLAVIVDTSMSMRFSDGDRTRFDTGVAWLKSLLAPMRGTNLAVLTTNPDEASEAGAQTFSPGSEKAMEFLDALRPTYGEADILGALQRAYGMLRIFPGGAGLGKEILFLTDGSANGWKVFSTGRLKKVDPDVKVRVVRWGRETGDPNVAVDRVGLLDQDPVQGIPVTLKAQVRNHGDEDRKLPVALWIGAAGGRKLEERSVRVPARGRAEVTFQAKFDTPGYLPGTIRIQTDGLPADDMFHFVLFVRARPRILLVDGDPKTSLLGAETYYLTQALAPRRGLAQSPFHTRWIPLRALSETDVKEADVLVFANVSDIPAELRETVVTRVRGGAGVIWFMGNRVSPERYDAAFRSIGLLPTRLIDIRESGEVGEEVDEIRFRHPALRIFADLGTAVFTGSRFRRYVGMVETPASDVLMRLRGGTPLLVESSLGKGRVMVFGSTADRDWNDFSIRGSYLPFLHNLFLYLGCRVCAGGEMPAGLGDLVTVGGAWIREGGISRAGENAVLTGPRDFERVLPWSAGEGDRADRAWVRYRALGEIGTYSFEPTRGVKVLFSVNPPPAESNLAPLSGEELRAKFGDLKLEALWREDILANYNPWKESRRDLTSMLIWALLGLGAAEVVIAGRQ